MDYLEAKSPTPRANRVKNHLDKVSNGDFAPGEQYITKKENDINYYVPNIFHTSPTLNYQGYLPFTVRDVIQLKRCTSIYNGEGFEPEKKQISMYLNHPIKRISIMGKVIREKWNDLGEDGKNLKVVHFFGINDGSTSRSITAKVSQLDYTSNELSFEKNYDILIKFNGIVNFYRDNVEIHCDSIQIMGNKTELDVELDWWSKTIEIKSEYLSTPWLLKEDDAKDTIELSNERAIKSINKYNENDKQMLQFQFCRGEALKIGEMPKIKAPDGFDVDVDRLDSVSVHREKIDKETTSKKDEEMNNEQQLYENEKLAMITNTPESKTDHRSHEIISPSKLPTLFVSSELPPQKRVSVPPFSGLAEIQLKNVSEYFNRLYQADSLKVLKQIRFEIEFLEFCVDQPTNKFSFKLAYNDPQLSQILNNIVHGIIITQTIDLPDSEIAFKFKDLNIVKLKKKTFHTIRKQICETGLIKFTKSLNLEVQPLKQVFTYLTSFVSHVIKKQEQQVKLLIYQSNQIFNKNKYKDSINSKLSSLITYTVDTLTVTKELESKFRLKLKTEYVDSLINLILTGNHITKGGFQIRKFDCLFTFKICLHWWYNFDRCEWHYSPELINDLPNCQTGVNGNNYNDHHHKNGRGKEFPIFSDENRTETRTSQKR